MQTENHTKSESKQVAVRLSSDLLQAIKVAASAERRKPAQLIRNLLEDGLRARVPGRAA
jgi:predicted DNA binding CopG/RHH family protein